MKKKLLSFILCAFLAVAAFAFAGCGNKNDGSITLFVYAQAHEEAAIRQMAAKYTEKTGTVVNVNAVSAESESYWTKLKSYASSKSMPDIFYMGPGQMEYYLNNNQLMDIGSYISANTEYDYEDLYGELRDEYVVDGKTYGIPGSFSVYPMGYNRVIIDQIIEAGWWPSDVLPPWEDDPATGKQVVYTWDQFSRAAAACTVGTDWYGTGLLERWALHSWIWTAGADWLNADKTKVTVTTPEFRKGLKDFYELHRTRGAVQGVDSESAMNHYQRWLNGQEAFFNVGTWDVGGFDKLNSNKIEYGIMPCPRSDDPGSEWYTYSAFLGYSVAQTSKNPEKAVDFILYYTTSQDAYDILVKENKIILPATQSKQQTYIDDPDITPVGKELFLTAMSEGHTKRLPTTYTYNSEWFDFFYANTTEFWGGPGLAPKYTTDEYLDWVEPQMQERLDRALEQKAQDEARRK
ncbi:MAG: extracellular solute-binding protein [Clostridiales bacterium]|jgi:multiple sugar transport system substrate-binding protein|nr:extracellular solute-binding protein [Clostridiales bacterium]